MKYALYPTQAYRRSQLIDHGVEVPYLVVLPVPLADLTPTSRRVLADGRSCRVNGEEVLEFPSLPQTSMHYQVALLPTTPAEWEALCVAYIGDCGEAERHYHARQAHDVASAIATLERLTTDPTLSTIPYLPESSYAGIEGYGRYEQLRTQVVACDDARRAAREATYQAQQAQKEQEEQARRDALAAEKAAWIAAHGSMHLQRATAAGYPCTRRYVTERAALEHPDYVIDFQETAAWRARACPSEAALDEAELVNGTVVWLTQQACASRDDIDDGLSYEPCEAVVIEGYLGKYVLVREM